MMLKKEIRVIGIDDSPFERFVKKDILVVGAIFRGGLSLEGILSTKIRVDGNNSTKKLIQMINDSRFKSQLRCIFLNGIALGGFNIVDIEYLNKMTGIPVIVVIRRRPDLTRVSRALMKINKKPKLNLIEKAGEIIRIGDIYVQLKGISVRHSKEVLGIVCSNGNIPEPLRIAHMIASGIIKGESKGKA